MNAPLKIELSIELPTFLDDVINEILRRTWQITGSQFEAAVALGIRPETIARRLRKSKFARAVTPSPQDPAQIAELPNRAGVKS
jgi:hypothetical protein